MLQRCGRRINSLKLLLDFLKQMVLMYIYVNKCFKMKQVFITTLVLFSIVNASLICDGTRSGASAMNDCIYVYRMFSV